LLTDIKHVTRHNLITRHNNLKALCHIWVAPSSEENNFSECLAPKLIRINELIKTARSAGFKKQRRARLLVLRRQPRNFENMTLVAHRRVHFRGFLAIFLVVQLPPKRGILLHKNSLASYQRWSHSIEPRALPCPFKQSNLSAWSYIQICRLWVRHSPCCTLFLMNCFGIEMVLFDLYLKRFDLTKGSLFDTFSITGWYKLCRYDHSVLELESFSPLMNW